MKKTLLISLLSLTCFTQESSAKVVTTCPKSPKNLPVTINGQSWFFTTGVPLTSGMISADGQWFLCTYYMPGQNAPLAHSLSLSLQGHSNCKTTNCEYGATQGSSQDCKVECES